MKQIEMKFKTWGGKRRGAGRKQTRARKSEPHRTRRPITWHTPVHVSLRVAPDIRKLRRMDCYAAIREAMIVILARTDFRIVHASIQGNHIHLLVEAANATALARGIKAFEVSAARKLNKLTGRTGTVFPDRYHSTIIRSRRGARNAINYVLNNWRRHHEDQFPSTQKWMLDKFSSAVAFDGWKEQEGPWSVPADYEPLPVSRPESWLLRIGWRMHGVISCYEVPGSL